MIQHNTPGLVIHIGITDLQIKISPRCVSCLVFGHSPEIRNTQKRVLPRIDPEGEYHHKKQTQKKQNRIDQILSEFLGFQKQDQSLHTSFSILPSKLAKNAGLVLTDIFTSLVSAFRTLKRFMKKKVALLCGGFTGEYVISLQTADTIAENLDTSRYEVYKIVVSREGWYYEDVKWSRWPVDKNDFSIRTDDGKVVFDVALIAIHGSPGEDGKLQGYLDMLEVPYTTCDAATSAITMNKSYTKRILKGLAEVHLAGSVQLFREQLADQPEKARSLCGHLQLPLFVKPNNGGSSIGMSKVNDWANLDEALSKAFWEDNQVLVEEYIKGREYSVGAYRAKGQLEVLPSTEIIPGNEFFDYKAKYISGLSEEITPGRLEEAARQQLERIVRDIYLQLNCRGAVRMDFIREEETGRWFFIEVNTVPGQSVNSILPKQIRASGRSMTAFYTDLIEDALRPNG